MEVIRGLCSFEGRLAGTDAERRAANWIAGLLRERGREADVEPTYVHPQWGLVHAVHCALGFAGSLVAIAEPAIGFALVLVAAISMYLDLNARWYLVRRLFFRRASQNVVSRGRNGDAPARLVLCAHCDAARTGWVFAPKRAERAARLAARLPFPIGPFRLLFWSLFVLLPILGMRMAGVESEALDLVQLPPTLALLLGMFALVDIELSEVVPGANDNASGVATVLSVADQLDREPPEDLDVWVLVTGAEECLQEGIRSFVRAHRTELAPVPTYFVCVDTVGHGHVRFETAAGWVVTYAMDRRLIELCEAIAEADADRHGRYGAAAYRHGLAGDGIVPRLYGFAALTIACTDEVGYVPHYHVASDAPENVDPEALERAHGFALELVRALDRDVGRRLPAPERLAEA